MDLGRGCPFQCSFCTIINVQGRKNRFQTADDLEATLGLFQETTGGVAPVAKKLNQDMMFEKVRVA